MQIGEIHALIWVLGETMSKSIILLASTIVAIATILTLSFADKSGHETLGGDQPPRGPDVVSWCAGGWGTQGT